MMVALAIPPPSHIVCNPYRLARCSKALTESSRVSCTPSVEGRIARWRAGTTRTPRRGAVRLVREHAGDYETEWAAMKAISARLGMSAETLRKWVRQAEVDAGVAPGMATDAAREIRDLRPKCKELESMVEILKAATGFFARECDPRHR
jgi:transposase